jgi:catechol 2,3-dioxygenase-like lactoylglutathione lyase family enzyme
VEAVNRPDLDAGRFRWAPLVPELAVSDLERSLEFWCQDIGFSVAYDRERFAYLVLGEAQIMLEEPGADGGRWILADLRFPYGRGINLQIEVDNLDACLARLKSKGRRLIMDVEEQWYRAGPVEVGLRQFVVEDPDGYVVRLHVPIGQRQREGERTSA